MSEVESLLDQLIGAQEELSQSLEGINEAELRNVPAEGEWSVAEIVGHVAELQPFWMRKVPLMTSEDNPYAGRTPEEEQQRLVDVAAAREMPWPELQRSLHEANLKVLRSVLELRVPQLSRSGRWSEGVTLTVQQMVEQRIIGHLQAHAKQIQEARTLA